MNGSPQAIVMDYFYAYICSDNKTNNGTGYLEKFALAAGENRSATLHAPCNMILAIYNDYLYLVTDKGISVHSKACLGLMGGFPPVYTTYMPTVDTNYGKCMSSPTLLTPTNGAMLNTLIPEIPVGDIPHSRMPDGYTRLEVSSDPQFATGVQRLSGNYTVQAGQGSFRFPRNLYTGNKRYYWRAYYVCDGGLTGPAICPELHDRVRGCHGPARLPLTSRAQRDGSDKYTGHIKMECCTWRR